MSASIVTFVAPGSRLAEEFTKNMLPLVRGVPDLERVVVGGGEHAPSIVAKGAASDNALVSGECEEAAPGGGVPDLERMVGGGREHAPTTMAKDAAKDIA